MRLGIRSVIRTVLSQKSRDKIWLIRQYIRSFGLINGLIVFNKICKEDRVNIVVSIPQSRTPILLRGETSDGKIFEQVFVHEQYKVRTNRPPKLIVDGGANVGYASVYFANKYPEAQIIAVEPEGSNFEMLRQNTSSYPNIKILQSGLWNRKTVLRIENPDDTNDAFRVQEAESGEGSIDTITIEDILNSTSAVFIDILKLDIEGAEKEVFENSDSWLNRVGVLIVELHDRFKPGCSKAFYTAVSNLNFKEYNEGQNVIMIKEL